MRTIHFKVEGVEYAADVTAIEAETKGIDICASVRVDVRTVSRSEHDTPETSTAWLPSLTIPAKGEAADGLGDTEIALGMGLLDLPLGDLLDDQLTDALKEALAPVFVEFWQQTVEEIRDSARARSVRFKVGNREDGEEYEIRLMASDVARYDARWIEGTLTQDLIQVRRSGGWPRVLGRTVSHVSVPASPDLVWELSHNSEAESGYDIFLDLLFGAKGVNHESLEFRVPPCLMDVCLRIGRAMYETMWAGLPEGE